MSPPKFTTRGWLVKETDSYIVLANSIAENDEKSFGGTNTIPKGMHVSVRKLKVSNASIKLRHKIRTKPGTEELHREPSKG